MKRLPSISVVIPNRNDSDYLGKCLNSVLDQTTPPDQIIFVDDQSSDNSIPIAAELLKGFSNSRIVANPVCMGTVGALNEGLNIASGDYVLFLSSNDYLLKDLFERAKNSILETGSPGVWSAMVWAADIDGTLKYLYPTSVVNLNGTYMPPEKCVRLANKAATWFTGTTLFFNRKELLAIGGFDLEYQGLADLIAALTIASMGGATFLAQPLGVMRMHESGYLSRTLTDLENLERILSIVEISGPALSPQLFNTVFCSRIKDRLRYAAVRALGDLRRVEWPMNWDGTRYTLFKKAVPLMEIHQFIKLALAMLLLRPYDILPFIWYRLLGSLLVMTTMKVKGMVEKICNAGTAFVTSQDRVR